LSFKSKKQFKISSLALLTEKRKAKFLKLAYTSYFANKFLLFAFFGKQPETADTSLTLYLLNMFA